MDIRQLRYFVHVAQLQSFSRAAAQLNVAQSALSRHVRVLESELGVSLFKRHGRGAQPTAAGKVLLRRASRLLRSLDEARHEVVSVGRAPAGHVSLSVPPSVSQLLAGPLIETCRRHLPHVTLKLSEGWTGDILEWLLIGHSDLGIIYSSQVDDRVRFRPLLSEDLMLIVSAKNGPLTRRSSYTLREVASMPLIVPPHPHGLRRVMDAAFAECDLDANIAYESQVWSVIKELVRSGLAQAVFTASEVAADIRRGTMVAIPIVEPVVQRTLGIAIASHPAPSPPVEAVYDLVGRMGVQWPAVVEAAVAQG